MHRPKYNFKENSSLLDKAEGKWGMIFSALAPELMDALSTFDTQNPHVPCPSHGGSNGFRLFTDCHETGGGICNTCGPMSNGLLLLTWLDHHREVGHVRGYKPSDDYERVRKVSLQLSEFLEHGPGCHLTPISQDELEAMRADKIAIKEANYKRNQEYGEEVFNNGKEYPEEFILYLLGRGWTEENAIKAMPDLNLRFVKSLHFNHGDGRITYHPALVMKWFQFIDGEARAVGLHRIWLQSTPDGLLQKLTDSYDADGKAQSVKKALAWGSLSGASIPFYAEPKNIASRVVAEGPETAWAARILSGGLPTRACGNAGELERHVPHASVSQLLIAEDYDTGGRGQEAGANLEKRLRDLNVQGIRLSPRSFSGGREDVDWETVLKQYPERAMATWGPYSADSLKAENEQISKLLTL